MKSYPTAIAVMLLTVGCATPATIRPDTPPQKTLTGWGYFLPAGTHTIFMGTTARSECEGLRHRTIANSLAKLPSMRFYESDN